jgi:hypothetical protein
LRSSGFSSFMYALFLAVFARLAFMEMPPPLKNESEDTSSLFLLQFLEMQAPGEARFRPAKRRTPLGILWLLKA